MGYIMLQVKVWLGENLSHYYVLSRFLISRMLTVTKIKPTKVSIFYYYYYGVETIAGTNVSP